MLKKRHYLYSMVILMLLILSTSGCSLIKTSQYRQPYNQNYEDTYSPTEERQQRDIASAKNTLRLGNNLSGDQHDQLNQYLLLRRLENNLKTDLEKRQYHTHKPNFDNDLRRINFLQLGSFDAKERWLASNGFHKEDIKFKTFSEEESSLVGESDVFLGMTSQAVLSSWGDPDIIEIAGNPIYKNERWLYTTDVATPEGFIPEKRIIYFESGRVSSWQKR